MRICFLCDLHLSENTDTLQYDVLDWMLCDLMEKRPEGAYEITLATFAAEKSRAREK